LLEVLISRVLYDGNIIDSEFLGLIFVYSYDQYHWKPVVLTVMMGFMLSSIRYKVLNEGIAIKIITKAGRVVQNISVILDSNKNRSNISNIREADMR